MSSLHPALANWWQGDRKILYIFALYGLVVGVMSHITSLSYDNSFMDGIITGASFPSALILIYIEWNVANPNGFSIFFHPVMTIFNITAVWSFLGLLVHLLIRMFKMGP